MHSLGPLFEGPQMWLPSPFKSQNVMILFYHSGCHSNLTQPNIPILSSSRDNNEYHFEAAEEQNMKLIL